MRQLKAASQGSRGAKLAASAQSQVASCVRDHWACPSTKHVMISPFPSKQVPSMVDDEDPLVHWMTKVQAEEASSRDTVKHVGTLSNTSERRQTTPEWRNVRKLPVALIVLIWNTCQALYVYFKNARCLYGYKSEYFPQPVSSGN